MFIHKYIIFCSFFSIVSCMRIFLFPSFFHAFALYFFILFILFLIQILYRVFSFVCRATRTATPLPSSPAAATRATTAAATNWKKRLNLIITVQVIFIHDFSIFYSVIFRFFVRSLLCDAIFKYINGINVLESSEKKNDE